MKHNSINKHSDIKSKHIKHTYEPIYHFIFSQVLQLPSDSINVWDCIDLGQFHTVKVHIIETISTKKHKWDI